MDKRIFTSPQSMLQVRPYRMGLYGVTADSANNRLVNAAASDLVKAETAADVKNMSVSCVITTQNADSHGDTIMSSGIDTATLHEKNPVVMFNHGWGGNSMPIGKSENDGKYTVVKGLGKVSSVTHFSQTLPQAEQVFSLIEEGILRGVSVGIYMDEAEWREDAVNPDKWPSLVVSKCRLFEYSHTPVPVNGEALTDKVRKGVLCGRPIDEVLLRSFAPYVKEKTEVVVGGFDVEAFTKSLTDAILVKVDERLSEKLASVTVKTDAGDNPPNVEPPKVPDETLVKAETEEVVAVNQEPTGSLALTGVYDRIAETCEYIDMMSRSEMNAEVQAELNAVAAVFDDSAYRLSALHRQDYPQLDPIVASDIEGDSRKTTEERCKARADAHTNKVQAALLDRKRLSKSVKANCGEAAAFLGEASATLAGAKKDQALIHKATLESIATSGDGEISPEKYAALQTVCDKLKAEFGELQKMHQALLVEFKRAKRGR